MPRRIGGIRQCGREGMEGVSSANPRSRGGRIRRNVGANPSVAGNYEPART